MPSRMVVLGDISITLVNISGAAELFSFTFFSPLPLYFFSVPVFLEFFTKHFFLKNHLSGGKFSLTYSFFNYSTIIVLD